MVLPPLPEGWDHRNTRATLEISGMTTTYNFEGKPTQTLMICPLKKDGTVAFDEHLEDQVMFPLKVNQLTFAIGLKKDYEPSILINWECAAPLVGIKVYTPKIFLNGI